MENGGEINVAIYERFSQWILDETYGAISRGISVKNVFEATPGRFS